MKRSFSGRFWVVLLLLALLVQRLVDLWFFCDPITGYLSGSGIGVTHAVVAAVVVVFFVAIYRVYRQRLGLTRAQSKETESEEPEPDSTQKSQAAPSVAPNGAVAVLFLLSAVGVIVYSVFLYRQLGINNAFSLLFMNKAALLARGIMSAGFKYDLILCLVGFLAALWFVFSAAWFAKGRGRFLGGRFYSIVVIFWFFLRIIRQFFNRSINQNNTLAVAATFAAVILAVFFAKYAKFISLDFPKEELPGMLSWGILSFLVTCGINAPGIICHIEVLLMATNAPGSLTTATGTVVSTAAAAAKSRFGLVEVACNLFCAVLALALCVVFEPEKTAAQSKAATERAQL